MLKTKSIKSVLLVLIQFISIFFIVFSGKIFPDNLISVLLLIFSLIPGMWAILLMNKNLSVVPDVKDGAALLSKGPYKYIRHPMYTSVIFSMSVYLFNNFDIVCLIAFLVLIIDLIIKLLYEEKLLSDAFPDYYIYKSKTKRLIPFVF